MTVRAREQTKCFLELQCFSFPAPPEKSCPIMFCRIQPATHLSKQLNKQETKENIGKTISWKQFFCIGWSVPERAPNGDNYLALPYSRVK